MGLERHYSVFFFGGMDDEDAALDLRRRIRRRLAMGTDVVLVCESPLHHRSERLALATASLGRDLPGRFAVVTPDVNGFVKSLPHGALERLGVFETESEAIDWVLYGNFDDCSTLLLSGSRESAGIL